jgi:peptidyl-prolyl cis-trans isomerase SurA
LRIKLTFADAARKFSDEKETRANGGALINPKTQDTRFELTKWILHFTVKYLI